jgi:4-hydroxy-2-oxoheptanedioate aldolase
MDEGGVIGKLAHGLAAGSGMLTAWIGANDVAVVDALAREAYDAVTLDMQHGAVDFVGATRGIMAVALAGKPAIVRVPVGDFALASRLLDAGAAAIIAPMINSGEDARRFVEFTKFPPVGGRSWGPRAALSLSGYIGPAYLHSANGITLSIAMVETRQALDALDDILATPGVDGVFVGPSDLSIALSGGAVVDAHGPEVEAALSHVVERVQAHNKFAGLFCIDGARAKTALARGFALATVSTDLVLLRAAARQELAAAR